VIRCYRYSCAPAEGGDSGEAIEQNVNYPDQDQLDPPGIRIRLAGDILWLAVTGFAFAAIIGILCWPISAVLSPRILAGATLASPTVRAALGTGASPVGITLASGYSANQIARPVAPLTTGEEGSERASNVASITSNAAPTEPNATEFSPFDPNADRPSAEPLTFRAKRTGLSRATAKPIGRRAFAIPSTRLTSSTPASPTASAGRAPT
jgi:hypothetical protein